MDVTYEIFLLPTFTNFRYFVETYHYYMQCFVFMIGLWVIFKKSEKALPNLSKKDERNILRKWSPKPLIEPKLVNISCPDTDNPRIVTGKVGKYINVDGKKCLNLSSTNFLDLLGNKEAEKLAIETVKNYGIGSCGPRGFYGTVDVHLQLEEDLAKFMNVEDCIVYSYGFSTIASAIPAYSKRWDIIFVDENVNFSIQKGLDASRSEIKYFKHNNSQHLEELLKEQIIKESKNKKRARKIRKFLIVEGIYNKSGDICPLPDFMVLKKKYCLRLFIDESISFGTLGKFGRGITDHFNIAIQDVDLIMCTMESSLASIGGFCVGTTYIIEHQRLSGLGYCFSASLPPLLTVAAITNLNIIKNNPFIVRNLQKICIDFHENLSNSIVITNYFDIIGDTISPIKHLICKKSNSIFTISHIINCFQENNLALCRATYLPEDKSPNYPSVRLAITNALTSTDISTIIKLFETVLVNLKLESIAGI